MGELEVWSSALPSFRAQVLRIGLYLPSAPRAHTGCARHHLYHCARPADPGPGWRPALRRHPSCDMTWPSPGTSPGGAPPAGHRQDVCWTVHEPHWLRSPPRAAAPSRDKDLFKASSPGALFKHFLFTRECQPACTRKAGRGEEEEISLPRPREKGPSRSLAGILEVQEGTRIREVGGWLLESAKVGNSFQETTTEPEPSSPTLYTLTATRNRGRKNGKIAGRLLLIR